MARRDLKAGARAGRKLAGASLAALVAALSPVAGSGGAQAQTAAPFDLRGGQPSNPRDITVDPRTVPPEALFGAPRARASREGAAAPMAAPGIAPDRPPTANGGPTARRRASRASQPVQARVNGGAQRAVRPEPRAVSGLPPPPPPEDRAAASGIPLRRTATTRIIAQPRPAPDALRDYPTRRLPRPQEDPWAPLGLRLGGVIVSPSVTQSIGHDSNPDRAPRAAKGSLFGRTEGELAARSDWSTHSFTANLRGGYTYYATQPDANRPDFTGAANLRLNPSRDTDIDFDLRSTVDTQRPGSPNLGANVIGRPAVFGYGGSVGVTQRFNRLSVNLRGSVDRTSYENARDTTGALVRQDDRNAVQYGARLRLGYEVSPGVQPFVEIATDARVFDDRTDAAGFRRGSTGLGGRVGASVELTRLLTGEVSVGYQMRDFEDARLKDLRGLVGDAALIWSATPLTTVTLRGSTDLADTTLPNVSGSINRRASLEVAHALRRNWTVTGFASLQRNEFDGIRLTEDSWQVGLRTEYRLTRSVAVRASFTHERLNSTTPGSDYTANVFLVGLRLQI